jgi:AICAR transformylase/IMP cyclohydrolase PurH
VSSYGDWAALSDVCDEDTARALLPEVSDGVIAPGYTARALELLREKRRGAYNVVQIDRDYIPAEREIRDVYGVSFEQGRNDLKITPELFENMVTREKNLPDSAKLDLLVALAALKYTQSNSVAYARDGGAIGIGAGQQSRIHCTRLAGSKADNWFLRGHPKVLELPFLPGIARPARDNAIDLYISRDAIDVLADGAWELVFRARPDALTEDEKCGWLAKSSKVSLGSDAFFPFGDNVERANRSGVRYIAQPGGSIRDDNVIAACDKYGIAMCFTGVRLFHH